MPGWQVFARWYSRCAIRVEKEPLCIVVSAWGESNGVVYVKGCLLPGIEDDFLVCVIRVQGGDDAFDRVVEEQRADADLDVKLEALGVGEERLVLADRLALEIGR